MADINHNPDPGPDAWPDPDRMPPRRPLARSLSRIGDFVIEREIGRGGMGVVYEATQKGVNRRVALKVLPAALGPEAVARFEREARTAGSLKHPGIVSVHAVGEDAGLHYIAMEYVEGRTLDRLIEEATLRIHAERPARTPGGTPRPDSPTSPTPGDPVEVASPHSRRYMVRVAELFAGAARALAAAHAAGVIHRDVKPSNLILDPDGQLRILDFGLARASGMGRITHTGETIGTPRYMSPELINPRRVTPDHRTDVYSLGVSLYETLTLRPAFHGENAEALLLEVLNQEPARPRAANPAIPRDLETVVLRAMAKRPSDRYPDAAALAEDLQRFVEGLAPRARRMGPVTRSVRWVGRHKMATTVGALVVALLLSLLLWVKRDRQEGDLQAFHELMAWGQRYLAYQVGPDDAELSPTDVVQEASDRFGQAARLVPDRPEPWFYRAICHLELGNAGTARADLERALAADPDFHAARVVLADLLRKEGDAEAARRMVEAMPTEPGVRQPEALYYEGQARLYAGEARNAFQLFTFALDARLDDTYLNYRLYLGRGDAALLMGDHLQALEDYVAARTLRHETPEVMLKLARLHFAAGRPARARACLTAVAPRDEVRAEPHLQVASLLQEIGRPHEALAWVNRAAERAADSSTVHVRRALLLLQLGEPERALSAAQEAVRLAPERAEAQETLGRARLACRQGEAAVTALEKAIALAPRNHRTHRWLALALFRQGRTREALEESRVAAKLAPRDADAQILYADGLARHGDHARAMKQIKQACRLERSPSLARPRITVRVGSKAPAARVEQDSRRRAFAGKAEARPDAEADGSDAAPEGSARPSSSLTLQRLMRFASAAEQQGDFNRMVRMTSFLMAVGGPQAQHFAVRLGEAAVQPAQCTAALETLGQAARRFPDNLELALHLGRCCLAAGQKDVFDQLLNALKKRSTKTGDVHVIRGRLLALAGDLEQAESAIRDALKAGWGPETRLRSIKELGPVLERLEKAKPGAK